MLTDTEVAGRLHVKGIGEVLARNLVIRALRNPQVLQLCEIRSSLIDCDTHDSTASEMAPKKSQKGVDSINAKLALTIKV